MFEVGCWQPWAMFLLQASFLTPLTSNRIRLSLNLSLNLRRMLAYFFSIRLGLQDR
jgi:hypothetical protein